MIQDGTRCSQMFLDVPYGAVLPPSQMVFFIRIKFEKKNEKRTGNMSKYPHYEAKRIPL